MADVRGKIPFLGKRGSADVVKEAFIPRGTLRHTLLGGATGVPLGAATEMIDPLELQQEASKIASALDRAVLGDDTMTKTAGDQFAALLEGIA